MGQIELTRCEPSPEDLSSLYVKHPLESERPLGVIDTPDGLILQSRVTHETYHFHSPDWLGLGEVNLIFDVTEIRRLIREYQVTFRMMKMEVDHGFYEHVLNDNGVEEERVASLTPADLDRPGIMVIWDASRSTLVDGNNRLVRIYRDRKPPLFKCFIVSVWDLMGVIYEGVKG